MEQPTILLIEDEVALGLIVKDSLESRKFRVIYCAEGGLAYDVYLLHKPDLLILDVMLPAESGLSIAARIRMEDKRTPILFLTALTMPHDVLNGFKAGGNDYLKKPFDLEELIVRVKVLLNQNRLLEEDNKPSDTVTIGGYTYDRVRQELVFRGATRRLTARESEVLTVLFTHRNRLLTRKAFLMAVWGDDDFFSSRSLDVYISKLRRHFSNDPMVQIINHRGFGYKLVC